MLSLPVCACGRHLALTHKVSITHEHTAPLSRRSVKGTFHVKGVGPVGHRGRIVSAAQSSRLPSSGAWPVALGRSGHDGMFVCMCMFGRVFV